MKHQLFWKWRLGLVAAVLVVAVGSRQEASSQTTNIPPGLGPETNINAVAQAAADQGTNGDQQTEDSALADAAVEPISSGKPLPPSIKPTGALAEVIRLVNSGVEESVLLAFVTNSTTLFNLGVEEIIYLNDIGVPGVVVTAMIQRDQALKELGGTAAPEVAAPEPAPPESPTPPQMAPQPAPPQEYTTGEYSPPPTSDTGYSAFYDTLAPYGTWVNVAGYGPCWQPTVVVINPTWQPYCDGGRWIYSDADGIGCRAIPGAGPRSTMAAGSGIIVSAGAGRRTRSGGRRGYAGGITTIGAGGPPCRREPGIGLESGLRSMAEPFMGASGLVWA